MTFSKRTVLYLILSTLLCLQTGCSNEEKKAAEHLKRGEEYFQQGEYSAAIIEYRNATTIMPKNALAQYRLGLSYLETKDPVRAIQSLQRAASLDATNIDANLKVAEVYLIADKLPDAEKHIKSVLTQQPTNIDGLMLQARLLSAKGQEDDAMSAVESILSQDGERTDTLLLKATLLVQAKQYEKAEETMLKAIASDEGNIELHKKLVSLYFLADQKSKAESHLQTMAPLFPNSLEAKLGLASSQIKNLKYDEAENTITNALADDTSNEQLYIFAYNFYRYTAQQEKAEKVLLTGIEQLTDKKTLKSLLADFYFETEDNNNSLRLIEEVLTEDSSFSQAQLVQVKQLLRQGKTQKAYELLETLITNRPKWSEPYIIRSIILAQQGMYNTALQAAEQAVQYGPDSSQAHHQLARLYLQAKEFNLAEQETIAALQLQPGNWNIYFTLAQCLTGKKEYPKALTVLNELHERKPGDPEILFLRGDTYMALGNRDMAWSDFHMALQLAPKFTQALARLVQLQKANGVDVASTKEMIEEHVIRSDNHLGHIFLLATFLFDNKQYDDALVALNTVTQANPKAIDAHNLAARIHILQDNRDKAIEEYRSSLAANPKSVGTMMNLAQLLDAAGEKEEARELYTKIIDINPNFAPAANGMAMYHSREGGDLGLALYFAKSAYENAPNDPYIADTLGWIYYKRGSFSLAIPELQRASNALPGNPQVQEHLLQAQKAYEKEQQHTEYTSSQKNEKVDFGGSLSIGDSNELNELNLDIGN